MKDRFGIADARNDNMTFHDSSRGRGQAKEPTVIAAVDRSYTRLTSQNAAMLLIDHQIGPLWELEFAETRRAVAALALVAQRLRLPTVITAIGVETWGAIIPELTEAFTAAPHIVRDSVNAWEEHRVRTAIERANRKKLIIAGGAGAPSITLCALSAASAGYDVYCVIDASAQLGHDAIARLSRDGIIVTTTSVVSTEVLGEHAMRRRSWR